MTRREKFIAREFLVIGVVLGVILGFCVCATIQVILGS